MKTRLIAVLVVVAGVVAACSSGEGTGGQLDGTKWILRSYLVDSTLTLVPDTEYADAEFDASRVSGFGGCNRYDALYRTGGRTLFITDPASTLMACVEPSMDFETAYLALLGQSRFFTARANTLTIYGPGGETLLVFDAAPENPLLGRWVVDSYSNAPGSVVAVLPGTELDVVFGIGNVAGFAGCNQFSGTYGTNGNVVRIGQLATTRIACADDVMTQETAFLEALQGAALIEARTAAVTLQDLNGSPNVFLVRPPEAVEGSAPPAAASATPKPTEKATEKPTEKPTASPTPKPTAVADAQADRDPDDGAAPDVRARRRHVPAQHGRRRQGRQDHVPGELVHGDDPGGPQVPVLRPGADHGAGGPVDARDRGHGVVVGHDVRGRRGRRDGRDLVGRDGAPRTSR